MFIGHYAIAFAAKSKSQNAALGTFVLAAQLLDLIWPLCLILGIEHVRIDPGNTAFTPLDFYDYPITHSLVAALGWSLAFGAGYFALRRHLLTALLLGACVFSHWLLDFATHRADLQIGPWSEFRVGLGLWNFRAATMLIEGSLFAACVWTYLRNVRFRDKTGRRAFAALVGFLAIIWGVNMISPPPPSVEAIAWSALSLWLLPAWGYWIDRHQE